MRRILIGLLVIAALIGAALYVFSEPDIPRSVLEVKYGAGPAEFTKITMAVPASFATSAAIPARVHFRERGPKAAPVLLLLHGSNASFMTWEPWSKLLSDKYRVIALDLPGHGLTGAVPDGDYSQEGMVRFVHDFALEKHLGSFALAGNSMGGGVAARYAEEHPDEVTKLILVDAAGMPSKGGVRFRWRSSWRAFRC